MLTSRDKHSVTYKAIAMALVCLFLSQHILYAKPDTLAVPGASRPGTYARIEQAMQEEYVQRHEVADIERGEKLIQEMVDSFSPAAEYSSELDNVTGSGFYHAVRASLIAMLYSFEAGARADNHDSVFKMLSNTRTSLGVMNDFLEVMQNENDLLAWLHGCLEKRVTTQHFHDLAVKFVNSGHLQNQKLQRLLKDFHDVFEKNEKELIPIIHRLIQRNEPSVISSLTLQQTEELEIRRRSMVALSNESTPEQFAVIWQAHLKQAEGEIGNIGQPDLDGIYRHSTLSSDTKQMKYNILAGSGYFSKGEIKKLFDYGAVGSNETVTKLTTSGEEFGLKNNLLKFNITVTDGVADISNAPSNAIWVMDELRPVVRTRIFENANEVPEARLLFPVEKAIPMKTDQGRHKFCITLVKVGRHEYPAVIKFFNTNENKHDIEKELKFAQVYDRQGIGPKFYGVIRNNARDIAGYVMQPIIRDEQSPGYSPSEQQRADLREICKRVDKIGISIPMAIMITRKGRRVVIDAGEACTNGDDGSRLFDAYINEMRSSMMRDLYAQISTLQRYPSLASTTDRLNINTGDVVLFVGSGTNVHPLVAFAARGAEVDLAQPKYHGGDLEQRDMLREPIDLMRNLMMETFGLDYIGERIDTESYDGYVEDLRLNPGRYSHVVIPNVLPEVAMDKRERFVKNILRACRESAIILISEYYNDLQLVREDIELFRKYALEIGLELVEMDDVYESETGLGDDKDVFHAVMVRRISSAKSVLAIQGEDRKLMPTAGNGLFAYIKNAIDSEHFLKFKSDEVPAETIDVLVEMALDYKRVFTEGDEKEYLAGFMCELLSLTKDPDVFRRIRKTALILLNRKLNPAGLIAHEFFRIIKTKTKDDAEVFGSWLSVIDAGMRSEEVFKIDKDLEAFIEASTDAQDLQYMLLKKYPGLSDSFIASAIDEAERILAETVNLDRRPVVPEGTILCHITADTILSEPQKAGGILNHLDAKTRDLARSDKIVELKVDGGKDFVEQVKAKIQEVRNKYTGQNIVFDVACHDKTLAARLYKEGIPALAFEHKEGHDIVQIGGILPALRALHKATEAEKLTALSAAFETLTGKAPDMAGIATAEQFAANIVFSLPAASSINYEEDKKLYKIIEECVLSAA